MEDHLYIMQVATGGVIKIGRAKDVERRRLAHSRFTGHKFETVRIFPERGREEADILIGLWNILDPPTNRADTLHRATTKPDEWFVGDDWEREVIEDFFDSPELSWPFPFDADLSPTFFDDLRYGHLVKRIEKRIRKAIDILELVSSKVDENIVRSCVWIALSDNNYVVSNTDGLFGYSLTPNGSKTNLIPIPNYLHASEAAIALGPPGWGGLPAATPREQAAAALRECLRLKSKRVRVE